MSSKFSQEKSVGFKVPICGVSLGGNYESKNSSGSKNSNAQSNASGNREMSVVIYEYVSKGSFDLPPSEIILSKAAERRALRINSLKDAFVFFDEFGAYYPVCTYTVGGVYMSVVEASGQSSSNMNEFSSSASSAVSSKIGGSIGIAGFELSGSKGSASESESGGGQRKTAAKGEVNVEVKCLNFGPQHVNIEDFRKAINANRNEWTNIGCNLTKLKPIYEIIEDSDKDELMNAVFYLKVAHIVKNLENSMIDQIVKKFENENLKSKFDIDLFLTCLSKDIQELAIEEFVKMTNKTKEVSQSDAIFKKFEKWIKQVYNSALNQNLEIIQRIFDMGLEFPDSDVQINNIYLERESNFVFILYYTDKLKRLDQEGWFHYLECIEQLKKKNDNEGHYVLCNLDLHHEVNDNYEMCLKLYYEGKQKKLMEVNEDFLQHHGIHAGVSKIELKKKEFTYYFEDEVFSKFKNLKSLHTIDSNLRKISEKSFNNLVKLEEIDLSSNKIRIIEDRSFSTLKSLSTLRLVRNKIEELNQETFEGLINLKTLELTSNSIRQLNDLVFLNMVSLKTLHLGSNQIDSIEKDAFKDLVNLEHLTLADNKLSFIEEFSFGHLQKLKVLDLSGNMISKLSDNAFSGLIILEELDLSENSISEVDDKALDFLKTLKNVNLEGNSLSSSLNHSLIKKK